MMKITKNNENFVTQTDWLTSYHHFSFGQHFDPTKTNFGPLRVFNDDAIAPAKGFGFHQHHDMEIVTYVLDGTLHHKDNFGNDGIINAGEVQRMSAGTGIFHSEFNHSDSEELSLLQIWINPDKKGLQPSWEQRKFSREQRLNKMLCVVSPSQSDSSLLIHQDVSFYVSRIDDSSVSYEFAKDRIGYLFVISGSPTLNDAKLDAKDSAEIYGERKILISSSTPSEIILLDLDAKSESD